MLNKILLTAACLFSLPFMAAAPPVNAPPDRFFGAFIQYWNAMVKENTRLDRGEWEKVLQDMKDVGITTIIIQHVVWQDKQKECSFILPGEDDPTEMILGIAEEKKIDVWIGLMEESPTDWSEATFTEEHLLKSAKRNKEIAKQVWDRYETNRKSKPNRAFVGWYIALEPWNFKEIAEHDRIAWLNTFLVDVCEKCKELSTVAKITKPVSMCAYFTPTSAYADAPTVAKTYKKVLNKVKIDVFMVQDGAGAKGWDVIGKHIPDFFEAYQEACDAHGIKLWGNLECYQAEGVPTTIEILKKQFAAAQPPIGKERPFVTWDFFHYMNPEPYGKNRKVCKGQPDKARKDLYEAYKGK